MKKRLLKNKIYFIISDIHSFADEMIYSLEKAGFDKTNKDHILIVNGDVYDRGFRSLKTYHYIKSIPKARRILITGNHDMLLKQCLEKDYPEYHDFSNGTVRTICELAGVGTDMEDKLRFNIGYKWGSNFQITLSTIKEWKSICKKAKNSSAIKWLYSDEWQNYLELDKYIITHSFIPVIANDGQPGWYIKNRDQSYMYNWRELANDKDWINAQWGCPFLQFDKGLFDEEIKNSKVLVCGHWYACDFHYRYESASEDFEDGMKYASVPIEERNNDIYFGKNLIAIDGCTAVTGKVNVLVLRDGKCFDQYNQELKYKE